MTVLSQPRSASAHAAAPPRGARLRTRLAAALLGLGVLAALLLLVPGTVNVLDGQSMLQVMQSIVARGDVAVSGPTYGVAGLHGQWYSKYGPGQSLAALPLYVAGRALAPLVPLYYRPELPEIAASLLPALCTALAAALLVLAAVELGATTRGALLLALIYVFATPAAVYATQWFSEPLAGFLLLAALYLLLRERAGPTTWRPLLAGAALAMAVATRLEMLLLMPPLLIYALRPAERRVARAVALLLPLAAALVGLGLYDAARFGSPMETGYSRGDVFAVRDTHPFHGPGSVAEGLYGLLISPGKGLLEYAPAAVAAPFGAVRLWRRRAETVLLLSLILIDLVVHANVLIRWVGGWSWGPRFLLPVLPLILLLVVPLLGPREREHPVPDQLDPAPKGPWQVTRKPGPKGLWQSTDPKGSSRRATAGAAEPDPKESWQERDPDGSAWAAPRAKSWRRGRSWGIIFAMLAALGLPAQLPALLVDEPHTYIYTLQPRYHVTPATPPAVAVQRMDRLEWDYINRPDLSLIAGSWRLLGTSSTWTPPSGVAPALVAQRSVTVAPHTWWRLLALQGAPVAILVAVCAVLAAMAATCLAAALRVTR